MEGIYRKNLIFSAAVCMTGAVILSVLSRRVCGAFSIKQIALIALICGAAFFLHVKKDIKRPDHMADTLGIKVDHLRDARYDYLRVLAIVFIITLHAIDATLPHISSPLEGDMLENFNNTPYTVSYAAAALRAFLFQGNSIFVMLSGALLLPWKEESVGRFYLRRVTRVMIPTFVYFIFYIWINGGLTPFDLSKAGSCIMRLLTCDTRGDCQFMWLIYVIMAFYVAVPFLRYMFMDMPYRVLTVFAAVIVIFMTVRIYLPISTDYLPFIVGWTGMAVLGYWITREESGKYYAPLMAAGAAALVILVLSVSPEGFETGYINLLIFYSPVGVFISLGLFSFFMKSKRLFVKPNIIITTLSRHGFTILLLHWFTMYHFIKGTLHISGAWYSPVSFAVTVVLTLLLSAAAGIFIDYTAVYVCTLGR